MKTWHIVVAVVAFNYALYLALAEAAHLLSRWGLSFHFEILLILFPALFLRAGPGLAVCTLIALMMGAHRPAPLGATLVTFCLLWHLSLWVRARLRREELARLAGLAVAFQTLCILLWSVYFIPRGLAQEAYWWRVLAETSLSALFVALLAGWWCRWQFNLLQEFGWRADES